MAKRKRLSPAQSGFLAGEAPQGGTARAPIAQVAGEAAAVSALAKLTDEWEAAREEGRMVIRIPTDRIDADHLVRDRVAQDDEAQIALKQSLMARGQQTPIEVVQLDGDRYGLISGWRRLGALRALHDETGEPRFGFAKALVRRHGDLVDSYVAMVEENEIRADLSFYERARIVVKALEEGVFETEKQALQGLFANATYARRSKIKSFIPLVRALDDVLRYPERISERAGLALSKALEDGQGERLRAALVEAAPESPEAEQACLVAALRPQKTAPASGAGPAEGSAPRAGQGGGVRLKAGPYRVELTGAGVTPGFVARLKAWLDEQQG